MLEIRKVYYELKLEDDTINRIIKMNNKDLFYYIYDRISRKELFHAGLRCGKADIVKENIPKDFNVIEMLCALTESNSVQLHKYFLNYFSDLKYLFFSSEVFPIAKYSMNGMLYHNISYTQNRISRYKILYDKEIFSYAYIILNDRLSMMLYVKDQIIFFREDDKYLEKYLDANYIKYND